MKPLNLHLVRHAQSLANADPGPYIGGSSRDLSLSALGVSQSWQLGLLLADLNLQPKMVYTSNAIRAIETCQHALETASIQMPFLIEERLLEMSQGEWTGRLRSLIYTEAVHNDIARMGKDFRPPAGESINDVATRVLKWTESLSDTEGPILAFTHNWVVKSFAAHISGWSQREAFEAVIPNASISCFSFNGECWNISFLGRTYLEVEQNGPLPS